MTECVRLRERVMGTSHPYFISSSNILADWESDQMEESKSKDDTGALG
jgi:hypothetical protein